MPRFDDAERTLALSVGELVEAGAPRGHLTLDVVRRNRARLAAGQWVHTRYQEAREAEDRGFAREVTLRCQIVVAGWTATLHGRVDGLVESAGRWVVEEVKSTAMDAGRLQALDLADVPAYARQLGIYLWMLQRERPAHRVHGRLVLVSLADGTRRELDLALDAEQTGRFVEDRLAELVADRERRMRWLAARRRVRTVWPFPERREGQARIEEAVRDALERGVPVLVQAPTGLGKTVAVLTAALQVALATDRQVFWATSRTTQQPVVEATLERLAAAGVDVRAVTLNAREKVCLNLVDGRVRVACRPEACAHAERYFDKVRDAGLLDRLAPARLGRVALEEVGRANVVCPYQLARDLAPGADVVVGDVNYAFDPSSRLRELFDENPSGWIVVADEVHQLVDRARAWRSPRVDARLADRATRFLDGLGTDFQPFAFLARRVEDAVVEAREQIVGPGRDGRAVAELSSSIWHDLADQVEELALDYALLKSEARLDPSADDPWLELARAVLRFQTVLEGSDVETVAIVDGRPGFESVGLTCLDPSGWLGPRIRALGGFVGASATASPPGFYRDLLGLGDRLARVDVGSGFPPERRLVLIAPRVSTAWEDRVAHAPATAALLSACVAAVPGNVAVYFPSFAMLDDLSARLDLPGRELLVQPRGLAEADRASWLGRLSDAPRPVVLAAVLGGIFAEGVDLPAGALSAVFVCGPGFPPVGLERDLLQAFYEDRYGAGFLYASLVPGLTRVVQAAGRLIRRPEDRGAVMLVDRRFRWRDVGALLPDAWDVEVPNDPAARLAAFFAEQPA